MNVVVLKSRFVNISRANFVLHRRDFADDVDAESGVCIDNVMICKKPLPIGEYAVWLTDIYGSHLKSAVPLVRAFLLEPLSFEVGMSRVHESETIVYLESDQIFRVTISDSHGNVSPQEEIKFATNNRTIEIVSDEKGAVLLLENPTGHIIQVNPGGNILIENVTSPG